MRGRECLVQVQVHDIESHIARTYHTEKRVHVRSVIIEQSAAAVYEGCNLANLFLEQSQCVRVGHHDAGDVISQKRFQVSHVDQT